MKTGKLFWGVILITFGVLLLLGHANIITFSLWSILTFWPLIPIIVGISLLGLSNKAKIAISVIVSIAIITLALTIDTRPQLLRFFIDKQTHQHSDSTYSTKQEILDLSKTKSGSVDMVCANGLYTIEGNAIFQDSSSMESSNLYSFISNNSYNNDITVKNIGDCKSIQIEQMKNSWDIFPNATQNRVKLVLSSSIPWSMDIANGASKMNADFTNIQLTHLDLASGASSSKIKFGSMSDCNVDISAGSSDIFIEVPKEVGCIVSSETGLSNIKTHGFDHINGGTYKTENCDQAEKKININIQAGVSKITIKRY